MNTENKETLINETSSGTNKIDEIRKMINDLEAKMDTTNFNVIDENSAFSKKRLDDILNKVASSHQEKDDKSEEIPQIEKNDQSDNNEVDGNKDSTENTMAIGVLTASEAIIPSDEEIFEKNVLQEQEAVSCNEFSEIEENESAEEVSETEDTLSEENVTETETEDTLSEENVAETKDNSVAEETKEEKKEDVILQNAPEKKSHWLRNLLIALLCIALLGYGGACYYFTSHFFYRTIIWGHDCSFKTVEEAKSLVKESIDSYKIDLKERENQTETLTAKDLGLDLLEDGTIENLLQSQKCYLCPTSLWQTRDYKKDVNLNLGDDALAAKVATLQLAQADKIVAPQDSYYEYQKEAKKYVIVPEVYGTTIDNNIFLPALKEAILSKAESFDLEEKGCYINPKIYSNDENLIKESTALNEYMTTDIVYDFGDRKEEVGPDRLSTWLSINDKQKAVLDKTKVREFLTELGKKYDTVGKKRKFKSLTGRTVEVSGGTYGWILNEDKEYKKLLSLIKKHENVTREPIYKHKGVCRNKNDIGKTYVDIDLSRQKMYFYKKGKLVVSTPVVTGDVSKGRGTPSGVYYILYKQRDHVLRGPGYASYVSYWMPFIGDRGIGIHDSSWRGSYGGSIYNGSGSHGCVNTPRDAVSKIYNNIEEKTPVVVHW